MSKKFRLRQSFDKKHGKQTETLLKSDASTFTISIDQCKGNSFGKSFS